MDFDASPKCHIAHSFNLKINNRGYLDLLHPQAYKLKNLYYSDLENLYEPRVCSYDIAH